MSLDKAIKYGKEHRKPYTDSRAYVHSCRNHGTCSWCQGNRLFKWRDKHPQTLEEAIEDSTVCDGTTCHECGNQLFMTRSEGNKTIYICTYCGETQTIDGGIKHGDTDSYRGT